MPRRPKVKATGVWEKEPGSGVWWIRYRAEGKLKREKVGRRSDAIDLYRQRKSDIRAGVKLPANLRTKGIKFSEIAEEAESQWWSAMDALGVLRPTSTPHATEYIAEMIDLGTDLRGDT